ncbi:MAG: efflux RND transporter periplasmic adaptor subunit [Phycisphaeraceae bacterium]|nr:efflux RND transporter periplasmic adaptor subunit [Phycisphaeraceae bacterium]MBX3407974.1 efflux RND transporter periplasmic adaptor subunit [Phycisphaeraceae bacterium]
MSHQRLYAAAVVLLGAALIPVIAHDGHDHAPPAGATFDLNAPRTVSEQTARVIGLEIAEVDFGAVEEVVRLGGIVRASPDRVQLVASGAGGMVSAVHVQLADHVRAGQPLIEITSPELANMVSRIEQSRAEHERLAAHMVEARASLEQTRTQLAVVEEQARLAEAELARLESGADAVNANIISQKRAQAVQARGQVTNVGLAITQIQRELESRGRQLEASAKAIAASERMVELVRASPGLLHDSAAHGDDLGRVRLAATRDGVVTRRDAWPGQGVTSGEALLHVVDYSVVQIDGELPESLVGRLDGATGHEVRIRIGNTEQSRRLVGTGRVLAISPLVNAVKRTAHLVIEAANPDGTLREGMYVELHVVLRQAADAVVVPASAVLTEGPMHFVFVEEDGVFIKHDIVPGVRDDRFVEVIDGLVPGDRVVVRGAYALTQLRAPGAEDDHDDDHGHRH